MNPFLVLTNQPVLLHRKNRKKSIKQKIQRGMTIIEILIALLIGVVVLGAGIAFMLRSSKTIRMGTEQEKATSQAQLVLATLVKEIKGVNIDAPPLFSINPAWSALPALPYAGFELPVYPDTSSTVVMPAVPAARKFFSQTGAVDIYHKWYPNPTGNESNSLVYYKALPPAPGGVSNVQRITYRLVGNRLQREVQNPLTSTSLQFHANPVPQSRVLSNNVLVLQFRYPSFEQAMNATLDTQLTSLVEPDRTKYLNENFRKVISIRIVMGGLTLGSQNTPSVELNTEVRLRSE